MRRSLAAVGTVAILALVMSGVAVAVPVTISDVDLTGKGATWDVTNDFAYGDGGPCYAGTGFTPAEDGAYVNAGLGFDSSDTFDGGLYIVVNGKTFNDPNGNGNQVGQQLTVGPQRMSGLRVSRVERALQRTPTLRSLVTFKNPTSHAIGAKVLWDSALGSDDSEVTRASSSGNLRFTTADKWVVSSDDGSSPGDPPVTLVVFGPGHVAERPAAILNAPEDDTPHGPNSGGEGCVTVKYGINVPAGSVRYLLFFTEMHGSNESAVNTALRFSNIKPSNAAFDGLGSKVRKRVLNFDLT
jgi:hypothetical protein